MRPSRLRVSVLTLACYVLSFHFFASSSFDLHFFSRLTVALCLSFLSLLFYSSARLTKSFRNSPLLFLSLSISISLSLSLSLSLLLFCSSRKSSSSIFFPILRCSFYSFLSTPGHVVSLIIVFVCTTQLPRSECLLWWTMKTSSRHKTIARW
jgi:hypothetical protein